MTLILPDRKLETMELYYPGRKPIGSVKIDKTHRYAPDQLCVLLGDKNIELVHNTPLMSNDDIELSFIKGNSSRHFNGSAIEAYNLPNPALHNPGDSWTLSFFANKTGNSNDGVCLGTSGITNNYIWLRHSNTFTVNISSQATVTIPGGEDYSEAAWWTVVFRPTNYRLFKNGIFIAEYNGSIAVESFDLIDIGASYNSASFAYDGNMSAVFAHGWAMSDRAAKDFISSPYQFLIPS